MPDAAGASHRRVYPARLIGVVAVVSRPKRKAPVRGLFCQVVKYNLTHLTNEFNTLDDLLVGFAAG